MNLIKKGLKALNKLYDKIIFRQSINTKSDCLQKMKKFVIEVNQDRVK
jgi:hypothetical protein